MESRVTDENRFPILSTHGIALLNHLREHPHAPRYTAQNGHRLTRASLERVRAFANELQSPNENWRDDFVADCFARVPFYRAYGTRPAKFFDIPTTGRSDLAREAWSFVPDDAAIDELVIYATSGTSGERITIPAHPVFAACYQPLIQSALARRGIRLNSRRGDVACVLLGCQQECFTYASVAPYFDDAGFVKINLHPADWRDANDRAKFLDACAPELVSGDPLSFAELLNLDTQIQPQALLSTSMMLLPALRHQLQARFQCPVLDFYSANETGLLAVADDETGFRVLPARFSIELLDEKENPVADGARGEITVTGGFNPLLPLLRYRTGDYARMEKRDGELYLCDLEGRAPVRVRTTHGEWLNNIDVTHALFAFALTQFQLHQFADGSLRLRVRGTEDETHLRRAMLELFGQAQVIEIGRLETDKKVIQYTSDLSDF